MHSTRTLLDSLEHRIPSSETNSLKQHSTPHTHTHQPGWWKGFLFQKPWLPPWNLGRDLATLGSPKSRQPSAWTSIRCRCLFRLGQKGSKNAVLVVSTSSSIVASFRRHEIVRFPCSEPIGSAWLSLGGISAICFIADRILGGVRYQPAAHFCHGASPTASSHSTTRAGNMCQWDLHALRSMENTRAIQASSIDWNAFSKFVQSPMIRAWRIFSSLVLTVQVDHYLWLRIKNGAKKCVKIWKFSGLRQASGMPMFTNTCSKTAVLCSCTGHTCEKNPKPKENPSKLVHSCDA